MSCPLLVTRETKAAIVHVVMVAQPVPDNVSREDSVDTVHMIPSDYLFPSFTLQGMLDFDFMCNRAKPSVACMVFPFSGNHYVKFYWGTVRHELRAFRNKAKLTLYLIPSL